MIDQTQLTTPQRANDTLTIRRARDDDAAPLQRLAELDSSHVPSGLMLVAEQDGELVAAVSIDDCARIADPFRPTAEIAELLAVRARQARRLAGGATSKTAGSSPAGLTMAKSGSPNLEGGMTT